MGKNLEGIVGHIHRGQTPQDWATARLLPSEPLYVGVAEVCTVLGVSKATAHSWIKAGLMPALQLGGAGSSYRVPASWLIDICQKGLQYQGNAAS